MLACVFVCLLMLSVNVVLYVYLCVLFGDVWRAFVFDHVVTGVGVDAGCTTARTGIETRQTRREGKAQARLVEEQRAVIG